MTPVRLYPVGRANNCSVRANGTITFPESTLQQVNWLPGDGIAVSYLTDPMILLFWKASVTSQGFKLAGLTQNASRSSGGKITCARLANHILRPRVSLPRQHLTPILLKNGPYQVALMLEEVPWHTADFSAAGVDNLPPNSTGVYQVLGSNNAPIYIGEGVLTQRLRAHLNKPDMVQASRTFNWATTDKENAVVLERVLLAQFEQDNGALPTANKIHA